MSNCTAGWSIPFSGMKRWVLFDPDMHATYWYYAVTRKVDDTTGFRFTGKFAHARYQAFNVYNDETKDLVWGDDPTHSSALSDVNIVPDAGSNNPFLLAVPRDTPDRDYTVSVVPEGADTSGLANVITFPTSVTELSIFLRVYLPDPNTDLSDDAQYNIGECHYAQKKYPEAVADFDKLLKQWPKSDKAPAALLKKGYSLVEMNQKAEAVVQLQYVVHEYPSSDEARLARARLKTLGIEAK